MSNFLLTVQLLFCRFFEQPRFIITIENGLLQKVSGSVKNSFWVDCLDIIETEKIQRGIIYAVKGPYDKAVIKIYGSQLKAVLQQLRNSWNFNG